MFGSRHDSKLSTSVEPFKILLVGSDPARRASIERNCIDAVDDAQVVSLTDVPSAVFRLAANEFDVAILDEVSLGPSPVAIEGMMKSLNRKIALLTIVALADLKSRNKVLTEEVGSWVSEFYLRRTKA